MHWSWLIVIYLFLGGLGAGAYLTSFAAEKGWLGSNSRLARLGYYIAAPVVAIGTLLLVFDLGQGLKKPMLLIRLLSNLHSVMTWGVYILSVFIIIGLIKGFLVFRNKTAPKALTWAGAVLALATATYTGLLIAVANAVPFWNTGIMPLLFVVSALSTGLSAVAFLASFAEKNKTEGKREGFIHLILIAAEFVVVAVFLGIMLAGVNGTAGSDSAKLLVTGVYKIVFWGYFIVLGLLFPLVVFILQYLSSRQSKRAALAESSTAQELAATSEHSKSRYLHRVTDIMVLVGGLALRALIIFAAIPLWNGFTLP